MPPPIRLSPTALQTSEAALGSGASATVYRGKLYSLPVAVKLCPPALRSEQQLSREVRRLHAVRHPNIIAVYGLAPRVECPMRPADLALVTELCCGGSLHAALQRLRRRRRRLRRADAARIAANVASALAYLHDVVYVSQGDVKGLNILLTMPLRDDGGLPPGCSAKLCDFGLSRRLQPPEPSGVTSPKLPLRKMRKLAAAEEGGVQGTMPYLAPEAFKPLSLERPEIARAADVYALGVVMYEMFSGEMAWEGVTGWAIFRNVVQKEMRPRWPEEVVGLGEWRALVERCWAQEAAERPSAAKVCEEIERIMTEMGTEGEEEGEAAAAAAENFDSELEDEEDVAEIVDVGSDYESCSDSGSASRWSEVESSGSGGTDGWSRVKGTANYESANWIQDVLESVKRVHISESLQPTLDMFTDLDEDGFSSSGSSSGLGSIDPHSRCHDGPSPAERETNQLRGVEALPASAARPVDLTYDLTQSMVDDTLYAPNESLTASESIDLHSRRNHCLSPADRGAAQERDAGRLISSSVRHVASGCDLTQSVADDALFGLNVRRAYTNPLSERTEPYIWQDDSSGDPVTSSWRSWEGQSSMGDLKLPAKPRSHAETPPVLPEMCPVLPEAPPVLHETSSVLPATHQVMPETRPVMPEHPLLLSETPLRLSHYASSAIVRPAMGKGAGGTGAGPVDLDEVDIDIDKELTGELFDDDVSGFDLGEVDIDVDKELTDDLFDDDTPFY